MKRIVFLSIVIILIIVIINLVSSLWVLWSKKDLLIQTKQQLLTEQKENAKLKRQLNDVSTLSFVEEQARDKLFMAKPGEVLLLFPSATPSGQVQQLEAPKPIWQQWLGLFF